MSEVTVTPATVALADLPGKVHGLKSMSPWSVQCDDCLTVFSGEWLLLVARSCVFNSRVGGGLRLCAPCWASRGWIDGYRGWEQKAPEDA